MAARSITPPNTQTTTSHAVTMHANGQMVGAINEWQPAMNMTVTAVFEFGNVTGPYGRVYGAPYEKVPGNLGGMTIQVRRYDVFSKPFEAAWGMTTDLYMLSDDPGMANGGTGHPDIRERWVSPNNLNNVDILYLGCWFSNKGKTMNTSGDRLVNVNATLEYTDIIRA